ncbi:membrane dipeptidase (peptidase family M19) [Sphingorhabdus sp. SMR4y]|nr:membrane dipeptidase (peptidase family M19) [Sphingorhabdus sp. SMR4y]
MDTLQSMSRRSFLGMTALSALTSSSGIAAARSLAATIPSAPIIDGLSFLPENLDEIRQAGLSAMICDVSKVEEVRDADGTPRYQRNFGVNDAALDAAIGRIEASDRIFVAKRGSDIGSRPGCAAFLQFQSCETIGEDLRRIAYFHSKGLRVLQLTHHNDNKFAGGAIEREQSGLTELGRAGIAEMNRVGLLPDVSHGSVSTISEAATASQSPVVYSHGACRAIVDHPRCITDDGIRAIADRGGVIGIFMMSFWLTTDSRPRIDHLIAHIRHAINIGGINAVGISNDFPMAGQENLRKLNNDNQEGVKEYLGWWQAMQKLGIPGYEADPEHVVIPELNNLSRMMTIRKALLEDGFSQADVTKIMGGNWQRVLVDVLG